MIKIFEADYLKEVLGLPYENAIEDKIIDTTRWSIVHEIVFEDNGKFYQTTYSEGATEMQPEKPWDFEYEVKCKEVELRSVTIEKWMPIDE